MHDVISDNFGYMDIYSELILKCVRINGNFSENMQMSLLLYYPHANFLHCGHFGSDRTM